MLVARNIVPMFEQTVKHVFYYFPKLQMEYSPQEFGLNGFEGGVVINRAVGDGTKNTIIAGNDSTDLLRSTIISQIMEDFIAQHPEVVPLACDSILSHDKQSTTLVFSNSSTYLQQKLDLPLFGAHNHFWGSSGLVRAWQGATYPTKHAKLQRGDVVAKSSDGSFRTTAPVASGSIIGAPQNLVFLVADAEGSLPTISKLTGAQAAQHFLGGFDGRSFNNIHTKWLSAADPVKIATQFRKLVEDHKVNAYMINITENKQTLKKEDLTQLLGIVADNKVGSTKVFQLPTLSAVMSVPNFRTLYGNEERTRKFDKQLTEHLQKTFPAASSVFA